MTVAQFCPPITISPHPHNHELCMRRWTPDQVEAWAVGQIGREEHVHWAPLQLRVELTMPTARMPSTAYPGDAGLDLAAAESVWIPPGQMGRVETGVAVQLPAGYGAWFTGRSSMAGRGLMVAMTLIDWGFRGPLFAMIYNLTPHEQRVDQGDRVAQLVPFRTDLHVMSVIEVDRLEDSVRGRNGLGSSGR